MASILRTGKFLRYFASTLTRNVVVNTTTVREPDSGSLLQNTPSLCLQFQNGFANGAATVSKADISLDTQIKRLDRDVRRMGRISRRDIEDVLEEIRVQRSATSSQSLLVIRCCGNLVPEEMPEVRTALVQEIWKTLNALNVPMDISHYNALLRVYLENEHQFSPTDFLAEIESKSIEPNRVTYQRLIARYCQQGDIDGATRILEYMRGKNLPVNEAVFNALILGHSQADDMESAKGILSVMKQASLEPSAETYTTLLCCYAKHGDLDSINATMAECEKQEILLLDKDILDIIYNLTVNGHGDKIDTLLTKFHRSAGFNQDCVNTILRLTNNGYEDVCLKLLRIMPRTNRPDGQPVDVGIFFIRQLVKANRPVEKILSICKTLQEEGLNSKALLIATEAGLTHGLVNSTLPLLSEMKNAGLPIRQHYFWPLICSVEHNQIVDILRKMQNDFNLSPTAETIRDYVIPNLKEKNCDKIITLLRDVGISSGTAAAATCFAALTNNKMKDAAVVMESYNCIYNFSTFRQPLIQAFGKMQDYGAFVRCIRQLCDSSEKKAAAADNASAEATTDIANKKSEQPIEELEAAETEEQAVAENTTRVTADIVGDLIVDVTSYFRLDRISVLEKLLPKLVQEGFTISSQSAEKISDKLASDMTPSISELLGKLSSGELELVPLKTTVRKRSVESLTVEELERFIANVEAKGENSNNLKRHLVNACFRSKNLEKTLEVIESLEASKYILGVGIFAQLIDLYTHHQRVSDAIATYDKLRAKDAEFRLDNVKTMSIIEALIKEERMDDALKFLEANKKDQAIADSDFNYNYASKVWRILNALAETGDSEKLQKLFDALIKGNFILPSNVLLGPLVKVHLVNDNIPKAIEAFEKICEEHKATPWKNELARRLIQAEDAANLQRVTDLSTNIHGEVNSLYDLVFSFVECGRIRQARKILETPGLRTRPHRIDNACERYKNEGMVESLEGLIEATRDLNHIDRNKIYYSLLLSYSNSKDAEKALGLWTKMQEENITPNDDFLIKLAELLKSRNAAVPFAVPKFEAVAKAVEESVEPKPPVSRVGVQAEAVPAKAASNISLFRKALKNNDLESALQARSQLKSDQRFITDDSHLIEQLVRADRMSEATKHVNEMLALKVYPIPKIFKFYLNRIANTGDLETMKIIGDQLTEEQKRIVSFDNRFCHANIVAGKVEQYFKKLSDDIGAAKTPEEAAMLAAKFPRGGAVGILEKHPEFEEQFKTLAQAYAKHNQLGPMNVLWIHQISNGNDAASKAIWDEYLSGAPRLMFQRVLQTAREQTDDKLAQAVISQLRESKISEGAIGNAYSCLIDIQTTKGNFDKALETLNTAIKDVCLENINRTALQRLKSSLESEKKEFPYTIPEKKTGSKSMSSSSSSSSSDDDVTPKRPETRPTKPSQKDA